MTQTLTPAWEANRTDETRSVETVLLSAGFEKVDAYRFNSASIRLRVIDPKFHGLSIEQRDARIEPFLATLPERTQGDIINLFTFAPAEIAPNSTNLRARLQNEEFENPSPSML